VSFLPYAQRKPRTSGFFAWVGPLTIKLTRYPFGSPPGLLASFEDYPGCPGRAVIKSQLKTKMPIRKNSTHKTFVPNSQRRRSPSISRAHEVLGIAPSRTSFRAVGFVVG
jgi:hypothetical protein